jgi:hypothetical protein
MDNVTLTLLLLSLSLMGMTMLFSRYMRNDKVSNIFLRFLFGLTIVCNVLFYIDLITSKL